MNRTDRLYAIVEDLRAVAPGRRSARYLAERYEVSVRTIERDISALQQAGVPVYADAGRLGGYALDRAMTLPPLNFTPAEAVAVSVALHSAGASPFARAARTALQKIVAAMPVREASAARELASRVQFLARADAITSSGIPAIIEEAVAHKHVLRLDYLDRHGQPSAREVEPAMFLAGANGWYLVAWCRLRNDLRTFLLNRIVTAQATGCVALARAEVAVQLPGYVTRITTLT